MITEEKTTKIFEKIINEKNELTTKDLNSYGLNSKDIYKLVEQSVLQRIKRGYYKLIDIESLYSYGKKLISQKEFDKSTKCFLKCLEVIPDHSGACFRLFTKYITDADYENVFKYFNKLTNTKNKFYHKDYNIYLYLLNFVTDLPEKYKRYTRTLKIEDLTVDINDKRYIDNAKQNNIRLLITQRKFTYALKLLNELLEKNSGVQNFIIKSLLIQVINLDKNITEQIFNFIQTKEYQKIIQLLETKRNRCGLNSQESLVLKLVIDIINIKDTSRLHNIRVHETDSVFDAVNGYNYELALKLAKEHNEKYNINNETNNIILLLEETISLINTIKITREEMNAVKELEIKEQEPEINTNNKMISDIEENNNNNIVNFNDIINSLNEIDINNSIILIKDYMKNINKSEYEFLIINLIKLSLLQNDIAFTKPMTVLTYLARDIFSFDISIFIQEFYIALTQQKYEEAHIYIDIIKEANTAGISNIKIDNLVKVLENEENAKNNKVIKISKIPEVKYEYNNETETKINHEQQVEKKQNEEQKEFTKYPKNNNDINKELILEKNFLDAKYNQILNEQEIILLRPMDKNRRRLIHKLVLDYPYMKSFSIGSEDNRRIVLQYCLPEYQRINVKEITDLAKKAFINNDYNECIKQNKKLLQLKETKAFVYARLGFAYSRKKNIEKAIEYLTIATEISKQEDNKYDFTDLISSMKGEITRKEVKPFFLMKESSFEDTLASNFGLNNIEEITEYINETGLDVESACHYFKLEGYKIDIVKLIYAIEYYKQGNYKKGDEFFKDVEQGKNKNKIVINLLSNIRKNKKFYIYREKGKSLNLSLSLKLR